MSTIFYISNLFRFIPAFSLALMLSSAVASGVAIADDATPEHARLEAALRQLDIIERLIPEESVRHRDKHSRFYFDYIRLAADIDRVRSGIRDYLAPSRAQPRDLLSLLGDYRQPGCPPVPTMEVDP